MNTLLSFELSKSLKEKGFNIPTKRYYEQSLTESFHEEDGYSGPFGWVKGETNLREGYHVNNTEYDFSNSSWFICSAPTITEAVMWLYDKHGIWIFPDRTNKWFWTIQKPNSEYIHQEDLPLTEKSIYNGYNSPTEAYEAAITYTLNNLI